MKDDIDIILRRGIDDIKMGVLSTRSEMSVAEVEFISREVEKKLEEILANFPSYMPKQNMKVKIREIMFSVEEKSEGLF